MNGFCKENMVIRKVIVSSLKTVYGNFISMDSTANKGLMVSLKKLTFSDLEKNMINVSIELIMVNFKVTQQLIHFEIFICTFKLYWQASGTDILHI